MKDPVKHTIMESSWSLHTRKLVKKVGVKAPLLYSELALPPYSAICMHLLSPHPAENECNCVLLLLQSLEVVVAAAAGS
jgi:hypothetical protein